MINKIYCHPKVTVPAILSNTKLFDEDYVLPEKKPTVQYVIFPTKRPFRIRTACISNVLWIKTIFTTNLMRLNLNL